MLHELTPHLPTRRASDLHAGKGDDAMLEARNRDAARLQIALVEASERKTLLAGLVLGHPRVRYLAQFRQPFAAGGAFTPFKTQIGTAHVRTPVTNAHLVCRLLLDKKPKQLKLHHP